MTRSSVVGVRRATWASVMVLLFQAVAVIAAPAVLAQIPPAYALDCDDQSGNDDETNAAGVSETYRCTVTSADNVNNLQIDAEVISGVNDPDDAPWHD